MHRAVHTGLTAASIGQHIMTWASLRSSRLSATVRSRPLDVGAGEQSGPLLWRIKYGGELARVNRPRVVHLMIGTNDFRANPCHGNPLALLLRVQAVFLR